MGISTGSSSRSHRNDINITPLIDVVLVLLIIFLVTMPVTLTGLPAQVPPPLDSNATTDALALVVTVAADLTITAEQAGQRQSMELADLPRFIRNRFDQHTTDKVVFVDFDEQVAWQFVVETMDQVRSAARDVHHDEIAVALVVKPEP